MQSEAPVSSAPDEELRISFKATVEAHRKRSHYVFWPILALGLIAMFFLPSWPTWFVFIAVVITAGFLVPSLKCPSCRKDTESKVARFCPECGAEAVKQPGFLSLDGTSKCEACGKTLARWRSGRRHKIRFCTHCGSHLDSDGV
jgi:predicted amidophosphoribosyltransferase